MKTYKGTPGNIRKITVDGRPLKPRNDLYNHSPDGFAWGYSGSGAAQAALAILADYTDDKTALEYHQLFKAVAIAGLNQDKGFTLTETEVKEILGKLKNHYGKKIKEE